MDMIQGDDKTNKYVNILRDFIAKPTKEDIDCHYPKKVLLNLGKNSSHTTKCTDYINPETCASWVDVNIPFQIIKLGQILIPAVPSEWTTMLGRRLKIIIKGI